MQPTRRLSLARVLGVGFTAALALATFAAATLAGLWLHLDLAVTRAALRDVINAVLADTFAGTLSVGPIERLDARGIEVASFHADDPSGRRVVEAGTLTLRGAWLEQVWRALVGHEIEAPPLRVESVALTLIRDGQELSILHAFAPRAPSAEPAEPDRGARRGAGLRLPELEIGEVTVRGELSPTVPLDASLQRLHGALSAGAEGLQLHVDRCSVREEGLVGAPTVGTIDYHFHATPDAPPVMWGSFAGAIGEIQLSVQLSVEGLRVGLSLEVPRIGPDELAPWLPQSPLARAVSARARLAGELPNLQIDGEVGMPALGDGHAGRVTMRGQLHAGDSAELDTEIALEHLDARLVGVAASDVSGAARVRARLAGPESEIMALVRLGASSVAGQPLPRVEGTVWASRAGVETALVIDEAGARSDLGLRYALADGSAAIALRAEVALAGLSRLTDLLGPRRPRRGDAAVVVAGEYKGGSLDVDASATVTGVSWPSARLELGQATIAARVHGPPTDLVIDARADGAGATVAGQKIGSFSARAHGPIARPRLSARVVQRGRTVSARGVVDARKQQATDVEVTVETPSASVTSEVARVRAQGSTVALDGVRVTGLGGAVTGALTIAGGEIVGKLAGKGVELEALSKLLDLPQRLRGKVDLDVDMAKGRRGHIAFSIHDGGYLVINGVEVRGRADFDGAKVVPRLHLEVVNGHGEPKGEDRCGGTIAALTVDHAEGFLAGPMLAPESWKRAVGSARVTVRDVELHCVAEVWQQFDPTRDLPLARIEGVLNAAAVVSRKSREGFWSLSGLGATTAGLALAPHPRAGEEQPAWASDALDVTLGGALDGDSGIAAIDLRLVEAKDRAEIARLTTTIDLDLAAVFAGGEAARRSLSLSPLSASLVVPRRALARSGSLPLPARRALAAVEGDVAAEIFVEGTLADPSLAARLRAWGVGVAEQPAAMRPDVDLLANYHGGVGRLDAKVKTEGGARATLSAELNGDLVARARGEAEEVTGWAALHLERLPLDAVPALARAGVRGAVTGHVVARGLGDAPWLTADLAAPRLALGRVVFEGASFHLAPSPKDPRRVKLTGRLPVRGGGGLWLDAGFALAWRDDLVPVPDRDLPAEVTLEARRFPLAAFEPFLAGVVSRVDGRLDGKARLALRTLGMEQGSLAVDMKVARGAIHVPGQELTNIGAHIHSQGSRLVVDQIRLSAQGGRVTGRFVAELDDLHLTGLSGHLAADAEAPMPLSLEGVPLGSASGLVRVKYREKAGAAKRAALDVIVEDLVLNLPESAKANVQPLDDHPDVAVSHPLAAPAEELEAPRAGGKRMAVTIVLAPARIEHGHTHIELATKEPIHIGDDGKLRGVIAIGGGQLFLLGKEFAIERGGFVRLRAVEPGNPYVSVTARWEAPNGVVVFVDYIGVLKPISSDKIHFRSSPALNQQEILSLLILGDQGEVAGAPTGGAERAGELSRALAAAQFNELLGDIAPGFSTSFSSRADEVGTTISYQVSDSITARATFAQAKQAASADVGGASGSEAAAARTELTIDWRFARNWLLRGTIGVGQGAQSGLDVLFQIRY